jgi:hypothetical protein
MSADSKSEATWRGFFLAAISAGVGTVAGMITGFVVGAIADAAIFATTGHGLVHYGYIFAEAGTYAGLFVGIVVGIGSGTSAASAASAAFESSKRRREFAPNEISVRAVESRELGKPGGKQGHAGSNPDGLGGAAAA